MRTMEELQKDLVINRIALDEELIRQPQLYWEASEGYTEAAKNRDMAKLNLERCEADCAKQIRSQQLEKLSDKKIADEVMAHSAYIDQYEKYLTHKANAEKWDALKDAFQQRSSMLRDLITLTNIGYWGSGLTNREKVYSDHYQQRQQENKNKE